MRTIDIEDQKRRAEFIALAAKRFSDNPALYSYTQEGLNAGSLFAVRWGMNQDSILVFTIADEPELYLQVINME